MRSNFLHSRRPPSNKKQVARFCVLVLFLCALFGNSFPQEFKTVHDGVEYALVDHKLGDDPVKINLLRLDLTKVRIDVHHALDAAIGVETTSSIATRRRAIAAINAGFFRLDKSAFAGDAAGILIIDGELLSEAERQRIALRIVNGKKKTDVSFVHRDAQAWFYFGDAGAQIKLSGINRERKDGEIEAYDSSFGGSAPATAAGTDIVLRGCRRKVIEKTVAKICSELEIIEGTAPTSIPREGYVLSLGADSRTSKSTLLRDLRIYLEQKQKKMTFGIRVEDSLLSMFGGPEETEDSVNGVPQLIKGGRIDITWEQEKASKSFAEARHPRTAVAKLKDGKFLMITVDGRQPGVSVGMNLQELAEYLLSIGAADAMNLDGGGSTTMFLNGRVVNKPSDKDGERKVSDAILVTLRR